MSYILQVFFWWLHWSTLCTWYVQHSQEFQTRVQYIYDLKVRIPKSWLYWLTYCLVPAPWHPPQPPIEEFWFVDEPQNLEIASREVVDFQMIVLPIGVWVIGVVSRRVWKINWSIEVQTSKVRVWMFSLLVQWLGWVCETQQRKKEKTL